MADRKPVLAAKRIARTMALNRQTVAVLVSIFCVGLAEQLWDPFFGSYLKERTGTIWAVGLYFSIQQVVEAALYLGGGAIGQRSGVRASLILFGLVPVVGAAIFLAFGSPWAAIIGALLISAWEPLTVPSTFVVVGTSLKAGKRTMAFALQSIQKRLPKMLGPLVGGCIVASFGVVAGVRAGVWVSLAFLIISLGVLWTLLPPGRPAGGAARVTGFSILRGMDPLLKRLLVSDILARWCDHMVRGFVVVYCLSVVGVAPYAYGGLVSLQHLAALLTYIPIAMVADRAGERPFVGLTFLFFAIFPLALWGTTGGPIMEWAGTAGIAVAFVVYGLREIGEPARKAIITTGMPEAVRAQGVGAYWAARALAVSPAPLVGAWIWSAFGPRPMLLAASAAGTVGALLFWLGSRGRGLSHRTP